jgi:hypothetical protein
VEFCGWERASNDPADPKFRQSHVHLNLKSAWFEPTRISSAELFADEIMTQARDPKSKLRKSMLTKDAVSAEKKKQFEMISEPPPPPKALRTVKARACEYPGCEGAIIEVDERRSKMRPTGNLGFLISRSAGFDFRFRLLRALIFQSVNETSLTNLDATEPRKAPKAPYRAKKPDMTHQQLVTIFQMLDYAGRNEMSYGDFMAGLRRNPDFAGLLGVPTIDLQKLAARHMYEERYGDKDFESGGMDDSKELSIEEFVRFFGKWTCSGMVNEFGNMDEYIRYLRKTRGQATKTPAIENAKWTVSSHAMKPPSLADARLAIAASHPSPAMVQPSSKGVPSAPVKMQLRLNLDFGTVGEAGSRERARFEQALKRDLSSASGLKPASFHLKMISAGSVVVDAEIHPDTSDVRRDLKSVAYSLELQATDSNSSLRTGALTGFLQTISFLSLPKGPSPAVRRWNQRLRSRSVIPKMTKEEALSIFKELGISKNESMTQREFVWLLRRSPHLEEKLGSKQMKPEELAAFFSKPPSPCSARL